MLFFREFDTDGSGALELAEFRAMLESLRIGITGNRVIKLFNAFDSKNRGEITDADFVRHLFPHAFHELEGNIGLQRSLSSITHDTLRRRNIRLPSVRDLKILMPRLSP